MLQDLDDLLMPTQFDWAEDVEEEIEGDGEVDASLAGLSDGKLEEALMSFNELDGQTSSCNYLCTEGQATEEEAQATAGPLIINGAVNMAEEDAQVSSGPLIVNGAVSMAEDSDSDTNSDDADEIESMQLAVNAEFAHRRACLQADFDGDIHHFNWSGFPVFVHNPTPAVISLLFLLADPKVPPPGQEWRYDSIMRRASVFVDPVIVYLENGWGDLCLRGFDLVQWATGRVFKFYSPHGHWSQDLRDLAEMTVLDDGDLANYAANNTATANGFVEHFSIRSRAQWESSRDECYYYARKGRKSRRASFWPTPSPLRQSMTPNEFDEVGELFGFLCIMKYIVLGLMKCYIEQKQIVAERHPSRLPRKRSFNESSCAPSGSLKRSPSIRNFKSELTTLAEEDSDDGRPVIDDFMSSSDEEQATAVEIQPCKFRKMCYSPALETIDEEDELAHEAEKASNSYISSDMQTTMSGPSDSATTNFTSLNEAPVLAKPVMVDAGVQTDHEPPTIPAKKDRKWKRGVRRFSNKTRNILRHDIPRFSLSHGSSCSSEISTSSTSELANGTDDSINTSKEVDSRVNVDKHSDSEFGDQRTSPSTLMRNEKVSSANKLATKFKKSLHRSPTKYAVAAPQSKHTFSDFCKGVFYEGIWAMGPYMPYPMIV